MDPFSFKADLEAQSVDEWFDLIHTHIIRGLLRTLIRTTRRILQMGIRTVRAVLQAGVQHRPNRADNREQNLIDERQA
jgi:hypothetical protein